MEVPSAVSIAFSLTFLVQSGQRLIISLFPLLQAKALVASSSIAGPQLQQGASVQYTTTIKTQVIIGRDQEQAYVAATTTAAGVKHFPGCTVRGGAH